MVRGLPAGWRQPPRHVPAVRPDFLTNYELGWKTAGGQRLRLNGALFFEHWEDFQFSFLGANGLTQIRNSAQARIRGLEADLTIAATDQFTISTGVALIDSELTENYCGFVDANGNPETQNPCPFDDDGNPVTPPLLLDPLAFKGTELPVTPKFKANLTLRQEFRLGSFDAYWRGSYIYKGKSRADLRDFENGILGDQPSYEIVDFSAGLTKDSYTLELFVNNALDERPVLYRFVQCAEAVCGAQPYVVSGPPRTIGLKFSQKFGGQ